MRSLRASILPYLHVSFNFEKRPAKEKELIPVFDQAQEWVRYAPNCWIIYTNETPETWASRFRKYLHADDTVFVCEINISNYFGWAEKLLWDWIAKKR
jgi:hypothetical protein